MEDKIKVEITSNKFCNVEGRLLLTPDQYRLLCHLDAKGYLREALINAEAHRSYLMRGTNVELAFYDDRIEIVSCGKIGNGKGAREDRIPFQRKDLGANECGIVECF